MISIFSIKGISPIIIGVIDKETENKIYFNNILEIVYDENNELIFNQYYISLLYSINSNFILNKKNIIIRNDNPDKLIVTEYFNQLELLELENEDK